MSTTELSGAPSAAAGVYRLIAEQLVPRAAGDDRLEQDARMLGEMLAQVLQEQEDPAVLQRTAEVLHLAKTRRHAQGAEAEQAEAALETCVRELPVDVARNVARTLCIQFDLANLAEDRHRIRVLQEREKHRWPAPRS